MLSNNTTPQSLKSVVGEVLFENEFSETLGTRMSKPLKCRCFKIKLRSFTLKRRR